MLEMKIIMILTLREFEIKGAYEKWDKQMGRPKPGDMLDGKRGAFGECFVHVGSNTKPIGFRISIVSGYGRQCEASRRNASQCK